MLSKAQNIEGEPGLRFDSGVCRLSSRLQEAKIQHLRDVPEDKMSGLWIPGLVVTMCVGMRQ